MQEARSLSMEVGSPETGCHRRWQKVWLLSDEWPHGSCPTEHGGWGIGGEKVTVGGGVLSGGQCNYILLLEDVCLKPEVREHTSHHASSWWAVCFPESQTAWPWLCHGGANCLNVVEAHFPDSCFPHPESPLQPGTAFLLSIWKNPRRFISVA